MAEMTEPFFGRVIVPVADRGDVAVTATALRLHVAMDATVIAAHVIEKAGGAPDKASVEQREQRAAETFSIITEEFNGTDIASSIVGTAHDRSTSAVVSTPRGGSRWHKLMTGDITHDLVRSSDIPTLVLPECDERRA